jgi:hypothetical protein
METAGEECAVNANLAESTPSAIEGVGGETENPSLGELGILTDGGDGPLSLNLAVGPPSPLTGCYLLIVVGEPFSNEHKDIIVQRILKGELEINFNMEKFFRSFMAHKRLRFVAPLVGYSPSSSSSVRRTKKTDFDFFNSLRDVKNITDQKTLISRDFLFLSHFSSSI